MALDAKHKAALAKAEDHGDHEEPDGDEPDSKESEAPAPKKKKKKAVDDKGIADFVADGIDKGIVNPKIKALIAQHEPETGNPDWVVDEAIWNRAVSAVQPHGDGADEYDDPWLVVACTYSMLGGEVKAGTQIPEHHDEEEEHDEATEPEHEEPDGDE